MKAATRAVTPCCAAAARAAFESRGARIELRGVVDETGDEQLLIEVGGERLREREETLEAGIGARKQQERAARHGWRVEPQCRVLRQDPSLELVQIRPGLEPDLLDEPAARVAVGRERVGLAAVAVERGHQEAPQPLAQRVFLDESAQLRDEAGMPAQPELGLDAELDRNDPQLLEAGARDRGEGSPADIAQWWPAPQRKGSLEGLGRAGGVVARQRLTAVLDEALEAAQIKLIGLQPHHVARRLGHEEIARRTERATEL